jgi:putative ABC transport system permease protein
MAIIGRSMRSLVRSPLRTGAIVAILAVSIGLALIMVTVHGATENQLGSIGEEIGTEITVRPAGSFGMMGGGEPLDEEDVDTLYDIAHVVSVQKSTETQYSGDALESSIDAGSLGQRGGRFPGFDGADFTMPVNIMGFDPETEDPVLRGDAHMEMLEGRYFTVEEIDADVAVLGADLADKNGLEVGSQFDMEGVTVEVIGIFESGQVFGDAMLVMPIDTVQRVFELEGLTSATVVADNVDSVDWVADAIRDVFDADVADVVTAEDTYERINGAVVSASDTSQMAMIAAFIVAAVVILFSVVLTMRQRVKEIGVLKAIGSSNWRIGLQFSLETVAMSLVAAIIGALVTYPLAQTVGDMLVDTSADTTTMIGGMAREGGLFGGGGGFTSIAGIDVAVSPEVFLYALGIAVALAVAASIFPTWYISRVKPVEVLRNE